MITTIRLPLISGRLPTSMAPHRAAPAGDAGQHALARGAAARGGYRVLVVHGQHLVDHIAVEHLGHEARADALDLVGPGGAAGDHR